MTQQSSAHSWLAFKRLLVLLCLAGIVLIALAYLYRSIFLAVALSCGLAFALNPLVNRIQNAVKLRSQGLVISGLIILVFGSLVLVTALILPNIYRELVAITSKAPKAFDFLIKSIEPLREWVAREGLFSGYRLDQILSNFNFLESFSNTGKNALSQLLSSTPIVIGSVLNLLLVPVFTWFLLSYNDQIRAYMRSLIPVDLREIVKSNINRTNIILWGILKGQLLVASILAIFYMIGFSVIGLQSALAIGAIAGICRVVPYLDVVVGATLSFIVIISQSDSLGMMVGVGIVIAIVQAIDGMVITPRIIGDRAGIHPVLVIASVISFGDWFGIFGIVIAVPVVAVVFASLQEAIPYYKNSPFYLGRN